jgi:hypothetical protein
VVYALHLLSDRNRLCEGGAFGTVANNTERFQIHNQPFFAGCGPEHCDILIDLPDGFKSIQVLQLNRASIEPCCNQFSFSLLPALALLDELRGSSSFGKIQNLIFTFLLR